MSQPSPDVKASVLDALLTQVRRIADALTTTPDAPSGYQPTGVRPEPTTAPDTPSPLGTDRVPRCVCGDPIERWTGPGEPGWIHSPGSDTRCLDARPQSVTLATPCTRCGHAYNWHGGSKASCQLGDEEKRCGCDGFTTEAPAVEDDGPLAACRVMDTRTCPESYNGPCGDRPCARFESDDPGPWLDSPASPAVDEDEQRTTRRDSLRNLLARLDHRGYLTRDEAAHLRQHIEAETREHDTMRSVAAGNKRHVQMLYADLQEAQTRARQAEELLSIAHETSNASEAARAEAQAAIERVRNARDSIAQLERHAVDGAADALGMVLHRLTAALDGTEQPTTEA